MKQVDIGCWGDFKKKYGWEIVAWAQEEAKKQGVILEDDTEVFYDYHNQADSIIYFGKDAVKETIGCAIYLSKYWLKRNYNKRKRLYNSEQMNFSWAQHL
ncbi:hypothetical protein A45J_0569 [hot springs metagenome]|uniref:Uncharacterized protein n=1 Tax=hot springs metagenome TaxID=433727 RepID=A0A5J4L1Y6_9ZZZZ